MPTLPEPAPWRVQRVSGLLVPGFSKRFDTGEPASATSGCTYFLGVPIGRFDVQPGPETIELRYRRWPVVDILERDPAAAEAGTWATSIPAFGTVCLPRGRRRRFCSFELTASA
ncbi:MAG: hypothetical protein JWM90_1586 [Thermoleophilia bacterium]|nr:hypothetical protein [Thermoleophilia bacterium]